MKKQLFLLILSLPFLSFSQYFNQGNDTEFGVTIGTTMFLPKTNFISTKPGIGFMIGETTRSFISDHVNLNYGISYFQHYTKLLGRENYLAEPEELKFKIATLNVPVSVDYLFLLAERFQLGVNGGVSLSFFHEFESVDTTKEDYLIDPISLTVRDLALRKDLEKLDINTYFSLGTSIQNDYFRLELSYHNTLSKPYKNVPLRNDILIPSGSDNFFLLSLSYYFY